MCRISAVGFDTPFARSRSSQDVGQSLVFLNVVIVAARWQSAPHTTRPPLKPVGNKLVLRYTASISVIGIWFQNLKKESRLGYKSYCREQSTARSKLCKDRS
jgi:hypothetical protein